MKSYHPKQILLTLVIFLALLTFSVWLTTSPGELLVAAQSTGDTLPTRTPTLSTSTTEPAILLASPASKVWVGRLVSNTLGVTEGNGSIFRVSVEGLVGVPIELRNGDQLITAESGSKIEYGPYTAEFAPVTKATWTVSVPSLGVSLDVVADNYNLAVIEFAQIPAEATTTRTATIAPLLPTITPTPTQISLATTTPSPTKTALPTKISERTQTLTPLPEPTPVTRWLGLIAERKNVPDTQAAIAVKVSGLTDLPVHLRDTQGTGERRCVTGQSSGGIDTCIFDELSAGQYLISPEGLGISLPIFIKDGEQVLADFDLSVLPPGITGWQASISNNQNSTQVQEPDQAHGVIVIQVDGRPGQVVALRSARGTVQYCEVVPVSELLVCKFEELRPGVYSIEALHTGATQRIFVDGINQAEIRFQSNATYATQILAQAPSVVGQGAQPRLSEPTATLVPTEAAEVPSTSTPTPTSAPTITPTPTVAFAWQGQVIERKNGVAGTIGVRVAGLKDHPVIIRSGSWRSAPQLTGTKPELGDFSTEFAGLAQGEYVVVLVGLADITVDLGPDEFVLVEFRYDFMESSAN